MGLEKFGEKKIQVPKISDAKIFGRKILVQKNVDLKNVLDENLDPKEFEKILSWSIHFFWFRHLPVTFHANPNTLYTVYTL